MVNLAETRVQEIAAKLTDGPLEEGVIVLDTETTGLSFKDCELIEIAAARLVGKEVEERFRTFVNPSRPDVPAPQYMRRPPRRR